MKKTILLMAALLLNTACQSGDVQKSLDMILASQNQNTDPTSSEIGLGLKEALTQGARFAGTNLSAQDGFLKNSAIKILFPPQFQRAENTLRRIGLGSIADQAITSFNRAAEKASGKAFPILAGAIQKITFQDALNILRGKDDAATQFLIRTSRRPLYNAFFPVVSQSADQVSATKHWNKVATSYNRIPFVKPVPADIKNYITEKSLDGLFFAIRGEEKKIRENPVARTTELLKRVFGFGEKG